MNIIAIDTSHAVGSVSLRIGDTPIETIRFGAATSHLVELDHAAGVLLEKSGVTPDDIDRIAVVIGPGSFTGLRIGLAYAKGLYAARRREVVTIGTLELLSLPVLTTAKRVCAMVDARKSEVYAGFFERSDEKPGLPAPVAPIEAVAPDKLLVSLDARPVVFVGSGATRFREKIHAALGTDATYAPESLNEPSTETLCEVGASLAPLGAAEVSALEPFYVRPSDAKLNPLRRIQTDGQGQTRSDE